MIQCYKSVLIVVSTINVAYIRAQPANRTQPHVHIEIYGCTTVGGIASRLLPRASSCQGGGRRVSRGWGRWPAWEATAKGLAPPRAETSGALPTAAGQGAGDAPIATGARTRSSEPRRQPHARPRRRHRPRSQGRSASDAGASRSAAAHAECTLTPRWSAPIDGGRACAAASRRHQLVGAARSGRGRTRALETAPRLRLVSADRIDEP